MSIVIDCVRHYDIIDRVSSSLFIGLCVFVSPVKNPTGNLLHVGKVLNNGKTNRPENNIEKDLTRSEENIYKSTTSVVTLYFSACFQKDPIYIT